MNQDAGLKLSAAARERGRDSANLEDVATGDIIVVEEVALKISELTFPIQSPNFRVYSHASRVNMLLSPRGFLRLSCGTESRRVFQSTYLGEGLLIPGLFSTRALVLMENSYQPEKSSSFAISILIYFWLTFCL